MGHSGGREGGVMPRERTTEEKAIRLTLHVGGVEQHISVQGGSFWQFWDKSYPLESGGSKARPVNTCKLDVLYGMMHNQRASVSCLWVLLVNTWCRNTVHFPLSFITRKSVRSQWKLLPRGNAGWVGMSPVAPPGEHLTPGNRTSKKWINIKS